MAVDLLPQKKASGGWKRGRPGGESEWKASGGAEERVHFPVLAMHPPDRV